MEILTSIVGVNFRPSETRAIVKTLTPGDVVTLVPEPTNPYDPNAIQVHFEDTFLGFIPRTENEEVGRALSTFESYSATVEGFLSTLKPSIFIEFSGA